MARYVVRPMHPADRYPAGSDYPAGRYEIVDTEGTTAPTTYQGFPTPEAARDYARDVLARG